MKSFLFGVYASERCSSFRIAGTGGAGERALGMHVGLCGKL